MGASYPVTSSAANAITWATAAGQPGGPTGAYEITVNGGGHFAGTINASGNTDDFDISNVTTAMVSCQVGAPTGTTPTLDVYLDVKDVYGNYLQVVHLTQLTGFGAYTYAAVGPGTANTYALTQIARFRWVLGGTASPSYPGCGFALCGR